MRPSLFYLRGIKFKLRAPDRRNEIDVSVFLTNSGRLECDFDDHGKEVCTCKFLRCARDVERGVIGLSVDQPLVRFLKAWDLLEPSERTVCYLHCGFCGKENVHVSLRGGGRGLASESDSESECSETDSGGATKTLK